MLDEKYLSASATLLHKFLLCQFPSSTLRCVARPAVFVDASHQCLWISLKNLCRHESALGDNDPTPFDDETVSLRIGETVEYQSRHVPMRSNINALMGAVDRELF